MAPAMIISGAMSYRKGIRFVRHSRFHHPIYGSKEPEMAAREANYWKNAGINVEVEEPSKDSDYFTVVVNEKQLCTA